jgi:hypothetical protein
LTSTTNSSVNDPALKKAEATVAPPAATCFAGTAAPQKDWRNLNQAISEIPSEGYCDQPYVVVNQQGEWVVVMTTTKGLEGEPGQHIVSTISRDRGRTWSLFVDVEPASGPEASWATSVMVPSGRIYAFYTYNTANMREVLDINRQPIKRVDTLGEMMCKFSDDGGHSWSPQRQRVPIRNFQIDDQNVYGGKVQFFWSVAKPVIHRGAVYLALSKVGNFGEGFMASGSGAILRSPNLLTERDPARIQWETLPDGNLGLLPPEGLVADEHNIVPLSDGSLFCIYRTSSGRPVHAYSHDDGHTWTKPEWATYAPGGSGIKQPRCFIKVHRFQNGKYALFFHNNGGRGGSTNPIGNRNPTWLSGGIERNGVIHWSQPEIFLYDDNQASGISYPDWIEDGGEYFLTETQKTRARVHHIPRDFLEMLWSQHERTELTRTGLALELKDGQCRPGSPIAMPALGRLSERWSIEGAGFSLEFRLKLAGTDADQVVLDTQLARNKGLGNSSEFAGNGIKISVLRDGALEVLLEDGRSPLLWRTDNKVLAPGKEHHVVINVDGTAKVLTLVIDGTLYDGGDRAFGHARFNPYLSDVNGEKQATFPERFGGTIRSFRVYSRCLSTSEVIGNFRSGN